MLGRSDELESTGVALVDAQVEPTARSEHAIALGITAMLLMASQRNADRVARKMEEVGTPLAPHDPRVAGVVAKLRARIRWLDGDFASELRFTRAALASFEEAGDMRAACIQSVGVGDSYRELGENAMAENIDWNTRTVVYKRQKLDGTSEPACMSIGTFLGACKIVMRDAAAPRNRGLICASSPARKRSA